MMAPVAAAFSRCRHRRRSGDADVCARRRRVAPAGRCDADQIVPIDDAARKAVKLLKQGTLKVVSGAPHGMCSTLADQINRELLAFIKS